MLEQIEGSETVNEHVIELNGKRYDAITGKLLGKSHIIPSHLREGGTRGKVIDGFMRPSHAALNPDISRHFRPVRPIIAPKTAHHASHVNPATSHVKRHQPERAKTLTRRAAQKPEFSRKQAIKTQAPVEIMARPHSALAHKPSAYGVDHVRQERATQIAKHHAVRHFSNTAVHSVSTQILPVQPAPTRVALAPAPTLHKHADIFEAAIAKATSHTQPKHKVARHRSRGRKLLNLMAIIAVFLVSGAFFAYLNMPQIQLRIASIQAGFGASMPAYTPTGYALENGVDRTGGTVTLSFRSGDSQYRITQQASNWDSQHCSITP